MDITGNWCQRERFDSNIVVREPWTVENGPAAAFHQELRLPGGKYRIEFEYDSFKDKGAGFSLGGNYENFKGLRVDGESKLMAFTPEEEDSRLFTAGCDFTVNDKTSGTVLQLDIKNTRVMRTWLECIEGSFASGLPSTDAYIALPPNAAIRGGGECLLAHGVPFLVKKVDTRFYTPYIPPEVSEDACLFSKGGITNLPCYGAKVQTAYFLGMIHNIDIANGSWYSPKGDNGYSHFVGDKAGEIIIHWTDGGNTPIPLIFGFNMWYSRPWDIFWHQDGMYEEGPGGDNMDSIIFKGHDEYRDIISGSLSLVDGMRLMGSYSCNARFIFPVDLKGRPVRSIEVKGAEDMHGFPLISAVTLKTAGGASVPAEMRSMPPIYNGPAGINPVTLEYIGNKGYLEAMEKLIRLFYTFEDELPVLTEPEKPEGYFGPEYDFRGRREALYAASYLYRNGPESAAHIADTGTGCSSSIANGALVHYTFGIGVWRDAPPLFGNIRNWFKLYKERGPGNLPGCNDAWSRGIGELMRESMAFGYDRYINTYTDWLDKALFDEANPPHWNRIVGAPNVCTYKKMVGDVEERGNRENDGHGICMWARYMVWHWLGRPREWNEKHWAATEASVEWIQWQFDNDTIRPGTRKDILYTESECAHGDYDFYSSYNCLHGIRLAIRMAEQLGKNDAATRWTKLYERLRRGILDHLADESQYGPIWHTETITDWQDHAHKLAHIQLAAEGISYTPLQSYAEGDEIEKRFLEIDLKTYRYLMKDKNYNCLRMYGYGQGMMTQSALLLDQMEDAGHFLDMLLTHCYLPKFDGWAAPEGIILHKSGKYYLPVNGYMGQDSHLADSTKAVRLMLGVDDNDPVHLRLVPRYPADWDSMVIGRYPVLTGNTRQHMSYKYARTDKTHALAFEFEQPVGNLSIRLGPLPAGKRAVSAEFSGTAVPFENVVSGDSNWVWVRRLSAKGKKGEVQVNL